MAAKVFTMPRLGQTMEEGSVVEWLVEEGGEITEGEAMVTIQSDKANLEVETEQDGYLAKILVTEDDGDVEVGTPIAIITDEEGEDFDEDELLAEFE